MPVISPLSNNENAILAVVAFEIYKCCGPSVRDTWQEEANGPEGQLGGRGDIAERCY